MRRRGDHALRTKSSANALLLINAVIAKRGMEQRAASGQQAAQAHSNGL